MRTTIGCIVGEPDALISIDQFLGGVLWAISSKSLLGSWIGQSGQFSIG